MAAEHLAQCADIHAISFSRSWSDGALHELLMSKGMTGLVAAQGGGSSSPKILGFILYRAIANECEVISIATAGAQRRRGVAKALMDEMIRRCLTDRMNEIFLEVDETNLPAINLYRKFGFMQVGKRRAYYKSFENRPVSNIGLANNSAPAHDAVIMRLDLQD
jgi:ribosomal-protein-alanine N-acetyltransferase